MTVSHRWRIIALTIAAGVLITTTGAAASSPSRSRLANRFSAISKTLNGAGTEFGTVLGPLVDHGASGQVVYSKAALPFIKVIQTADKDLLAMGAKGKTEVDVKALVVVDVKLISDLHSVAPETAKEVPGWTQILAKDATSTSAITNRIRSDLGLSS
jgi:hypothetical protein